MLRNFDLAWLLRDRLRLLQEPTWRFLASVMATAFPRLYCTAELNVNHFVKHLGIFLIETNDILLVAITMWFYLFI